MKNGLKVNRITKKNKIPLMKEFLLETKSLKHKICCGAPPWRYIREVHYDIVQHWCSRMTWTFNFFTHISEHIMDLQIILLFQKVMILEICSGICSSIVDKEVFFVTEMQKLAIWHRYFGTLATWYAEGIISQLWYEVSGEERIKY